MRLGLFIGGIVLVILVSVCVQRYSFLVRTGFSLVWHILTATARNVGLMTKLKICISYYQVSG